MWCAMVAVWKEHYYYGDDDDGVVCLLCHVIRDYKVKGENVSTFPPSIFLRTTLAEKIEKRGKLQRIAFTRMCRFCM